ncbi:hypothetical protein HBH56_216370 [Parastagonospora nodorum]|nr:hypothetical protein HBH56_216370 [Parastagonospora nodorum]KAH4018837.1 hypothetical protein HBI09_190240 [Parastagonospora nodorum]KAH4061709.1 hypothetical protein HBH50_219420 [Parastagonospora nodorum]KAH4115338.1 hypothetical protein HBH47_182560 [Parastagonospora nodorum]KAH4183173.1 hypothetical protein HBH42_210550 [Parastagonospora nodorum]
MKPENARYALRLSSNLSRLLLHVVSGIRPPRSPHLILGHWVADLLDIDEFLYAHDLTSNGLRDRVVNGRHAFAQAERFEHTLGLQRETNAGAHQSYPEIGHVGVGRVRGQFTVGSATEALIASLAPSSSLKFALLSSRQVAASDGSGERMTLYREMAVRQLLDRCLQMRPCWKMQLSARCHALLFSRVGILSQYVLSTCVARFTSLFAAFVTFLCFVCKHPSIHQKVTQYLEKAYSETGRTSQMYACIRTGKGCWHARG